MTEQLADGAQSLASSGLNSDQRVACLNLALTFLQSVVSAETDHSPGGEGSFIKKNKQRSIAALNA